MEASLMPNKSSIKIDEIPGKEQFQTHISMAEETGYIQVEHFLYEVEWKYDLKLNPIQMLIFHAAGSMHPPPSFAELENIFKINRAFLKRSIQSIDDLCIESDHEIFLTEKGINTFNSLKKNKIMKTFISIDYIPILKQLVIYFCEYTKNQTFSESYKNIADYIFGSAQPSYFEDIGRNIIPEIENALNSKYIPPTSETTTTEKRNDPDLFLYKSLIRAKLKKKSFLNLELNLHLLIDSLTNQPKIVITSGNISSKNSLNSLFSFYKHLLHDENFHVFTDLHEILNVYMKNEMFKIEDFFCLDKMALTKDEKEYDRLNRKHIETVLNKINNRTSIEVFQGKTFTATLLKSLKKAKKYAIISSPSIREQDFNKELMNIFKFLVKNKVHIILGYGITQEKNLFIEPNVNEIKKYLAPIRFRNGVPYLHFLFLENFHPKEIIIDDEIYFCTIMNWLSFKDHKYMRTENILKFQNFKRGINQIKRFYVNEIKKKVNADWNSESDIDKQKILDEFYLLWAVDKDPTVFRKLNEKVLDILVEPWICMLGNLMKTDISQFQNRSLKLINYLDKKNFVHKYKKQLKKFDTSIIKLINDPKYSGQRITYKNSLEIVHDKLKKYIT